MITPRSSKISSVRGWMPLPRDPSKGVAAGLDQTKGIPRRARSMARVKPVGPAPAINTVVSYIVRYIVMVQCTNVKTKIAVDPREIAAAALAIADREGFEAVSMRRVAQELKVGTMSLYYYVKDKDDLIAAMDDSSWGKRSYRRFPKVGSAR